MTVESRSQGRPARGEGEVGRDRLLERTRDALRRKPRVDLQRREIAMYAGVTPALVSYYFPDKWDLFAAAARPAVEAYLADLVDVLHSAGSFRAQMASLAFVLIEFYHNQGCMLDFYLENSDRMARKDDVRALEAVYAEIEFFFEGLLRAGLIRGQNAALIWSSLCGSCKQIAHQPHFAGLADPSDKERALRSQADDVCDLFLNGIATPGLLHTVTPEGGYFAAAVGGVNGIAADELWEADGAGRQGSKKASPGADHPGSRDVFTRAKRLPA